MQTNRTLATETSYSCLDARFQAHSGATQRLETAAKRKTPLCCSSSGFLWYAAGPLPQKCSPIDRLMFVFEVLQYFGFWKKHLFFFNTNLNVFFFFFYGGLMSIWSHFQSNKEWITDCLIWWWNTHNRRWPSGRAGSTVSLYAFRSYHSPRFRAKKTTTKKVKTPLDQREVVVPHTLTHIPVYTGQVLNASLKHSIMTS